MSGTTGIQWTDSTSADEQREHRPVIEQRRTDEIDRVIGQSAQPRQRVAVALPAVARRARRDHVAADRLTATSDRDDVVKADRRTTAAVGAQAARRIRQQVRADIAGHPTDTTTARTGRPPFVGPARRPVRLAVGLIPVHATRTLPDVVSRAPRLAATTPRLTAGACTAALRDRRAGCFADERRAAARRETIRTRPVGTEVAPVVPCTVDAAPLLPGRDVRAVVGLTDTDPRSGRSDRPGRASHTPILSRRELDGRTHDGYPVASGA